MYIDEQRFATLQENENRNKAHSYVKKEPVDAYKPKDYSVNIKTLASGYASSKSYVDKHSAFSEDTLKKYKTSADNTYEPSYPSHNVLNKNNNNNSHRETYDTLKPQRKRTQVKKQNLNDSWEQAMDDNNKANADEFTTYQKPRQAMEDNNKANVDEFNTYQKPRQAEVAAPRKQANLLEDDNFNFNAMKNELKEEQYNYDDDSSGDEGNKDFQYDFFKESGNNNGGHSTNANSLNLNARVQQNQNNFGVQDEEVTAGGQEYFGLGDVFSQSQSQPQAQPTQNAPSNQNDLFQSPAPSFPQSQQNDFFTNQPQSNQNDFFTNQPQNTTDDIFNTPATGYQNPVSQPQQNMFAPDPFQSNQMMPQNYNTVKGGYQPNLPI
jgi:hypothetical protein